MYIKFIKHRFKLKIDTKLLNFAFEIKKLGEAFNEIKCLKCNEKAKFITVDKDNPDVYCEEHKLRLDNIEHRFKEIRDYWLYDVRCYIFEIKEMIVNIQILLGTLKNDPCYDLLSSKLNLVVFDIIAFEFNQNFFFVFMLI